MKRWIRLLTVLCFAFLCESFFGHSFLGNSSLSWAQAPAPVLKPLTIIKAGTVIDGVSNTARHDQVITIRGNVITDIANASSATIPADALVIDLSKATVLPGLFDAERAATPGSRSPPCKTQQNSPFAPRRWRHKWLWPLARVVAVEVV